MKTLLNPVTNHPATLEADFNLSEATASKAMQGCAEPTMLDAALAYAKQGLAVFPLHNPLPDGNCSCGKKDCGKSTGKHPRTAKGLKAATTNELQLRRWFRDWPEANIGLPCGEENGVIVLDVDGVKGEKSLERLVDLNGPLPATRKVVTGKGFHLYFKHPGGKVRNVAQIDAAYPGLDSRADGGYVVAPPSLHLSGMRYQVDPQSPDKIAAAPAWLVDFINRRSKNTPGVATASATNDDLGEGSRNSTLASIAGVMRRTGSPPEVLEGALLAINAERCRPPLPDDEVRQIAQSIARYPPDSADSVRRSLTDIGNAERFAARHATTTRFVPEWGKWLHWQGTHWEADAAGSVMEKAKEVARDVYQEGNAISDPNLRTEIARHAKLSCQAARLRAMVELASSGPLLVVRANQLDEKRSLLGVQNGTVDLSDGSLKAPTQSDYITMLASIVYDPVAACPVFGKFLDRIMGGDAELITYLQRVIGYSLSGYTSEQCLFFLYGAGANGKSTLLNLLRDLLGPSYCKYTPTETITVRPGKAGATPELTRLPGARTVITNEIEDNSWLAESLVKQMTGGDPLTARNLYQDYFEFVPQFKLFIAGNHKPIIRGDDIGIWRRIHLIPFLVTIPQEERDSQLAYKLRNELSGILNWAIAGYEAWRERGLAPPPKVTGAVETYKQEMDLFGQWMDECCDVGEALETTARCAYACFRWWATTSGYRPWSIASFGRKVAERCATRRTKQGMVYCGFAVRSQFEYGQPMNRG